MMMKSQWCFRRAKGKTKTLESCGLLTQKGAFMGTRPGGDSPMNREERGQTERCPHESREQMCGLRLCPA